MPKAVADKFVVDGNMRKYTTIVGQPDKTEKTVEYEVPTPEYFKSFVAALSDVKQAYEDFVDGLRKRIRYDAYEAASAESTWITTGKNADGSAVRKDLLTFPLQNFVDAFNFQWNGLSAKAKMLETTVDEIDRGFGAWLAASRKHAEAGKVKVNVDGTVTVV